MITAGRYSVWFRTPVGEGIGVVIFCSDGKLSGGDTTFSYFGDWEQDQNRFRAKISAKRTSPGPPGVFGMDEVDIIVTGRPNNGPTFLCTGFAKQAPGLKLDVTLDLIHNE